MLDTSNGCMTNRSHTMYSKNNIVQLQLPLGFIEIPLNRGFVALIDAKFYNEVSQFKWYEKRGYAQRGEYRDGKMYTVFLHRVIMELHLGITLTRTDEVDHIHHNTLDNRISELRLATKSQNQCNRKINKNNKSGYKGVRWHEVNNKWVAYARHNGKRKHLGYYNTAEEAYTAYCDFALNNYGEFANL